MMSYTTSGILQVGSEPFDLGRIVRAITTHTDKVIQCYLSGRLIGWQRPSGGAVAFVVPEAGPEDVFLLLAVEEALADENFWSEAFPQAAARGNRLHVRIPQRMAFGADDVLKIYRGDAGDVEADRLVLEQDIYAAGRRACGWGLGACGSGGYGWDGAEAAGWGYGCGLGEYGFDCRMLGWTSEALPPGEYPLKVLVTDACGNESTAFETTVTLDTYARPASGLSVSSYDKATDALALTWTESPDIH